MSIVLLVVLIAVVVFGAIILIGLGKIFWSILCPGGVDRND